MSTSQNLHLYQSSIQLPQLSPQLAYQALPDPPQNTESVSQSNISEILLHNVNSQTNSMRNRVPNFERARNSEAEFNKSFDRFYTKYHSNQGFTLIIFLLMITMVTSSESLAIFWLIILGVMYFAHLIRSLYRIETLIDTVRIFFKIGEVFGVVLLKMFNPFDSEENATYFLVACLFINYLVKAGLGYYANRAQFVRFTNHVNKTILGIRACIFVQGLLVVAVGSSDNKVPVSIFPIPYCIIILILVLFTVNFIRNVYFVHKDLFWRSDVSEKKTGLLWILGNLFTIIALLLLQILVIFVDNGDSEVLVFISIVTWCSISSLYNDHCREGVFRVCEDLAIIIENKGRVRVESATEDIRYVTKISNTYFRPVTQQEFDRLSNRSSSSTSTGVSGQEDLEAGIEGNNGEERLRCIVCCRDLADAVFMGCGHGGICFSCGQQISEQQQKECHMCRQKIISLLKMNLEDNKENVYEIIDEIRSYEQREISWYACV